MRTAVVYEEEPNAEPCHDGECAGQFLNMSMGGDRVSNLRFVGRRERGGEGKVEEIREEEEGARGQTHEVEATAH